MVSAKQEISQIPASGINLKIFQADRFILEISLILKDSLRQRKNIKIMANLTSYEIVWATLRKDPTKAYFLFEAQPEIRIGYTPILNNI